MDDPSNLPRPALIIGSFLVVATVMIVIGLVFGERFRELRSRGRDGDTEESDHRLEIALGALLTTFAFVAAFMLGQFWAAAGQARNAVLDEVTALTALRSMAVALPEHSSALLDATARYATEVESVEWPAMREGRTDDAEAAHLRASQTLISTVGALSTGTDDPQAWQGLITQAEAVTVAGTERITAMPGSVFPRLMVLLAALGIPSLALGTLLAPRSRPVLILADLGLAASVVILTVIVAEAANPYRTGAVTLLPLH